MTKLSGPWPSRKNLKSTEVGRSGADYVQSSPIPGVEESPGVPARSVRSILAIVASRAVPLLARQDRSGILKASRDMADPVAIEASEKGQPGGVATLGADSKIPSNQLSPLAISETSVVNTQAAMLALAAQVGDVAVRTDQRRSYILRAEPASTLSNWQELLTPTDAVISVDGKTGAVSLADLYVAANDSRLHSRAHNLSSSADHPDVKAAPSDGQVYVYRASGASGAGFYPENPAAASVPSADEAQEGKTRQATQAQVEAGPAGNLFATVARAKAELDRRDKLGLFRAFLTAPRTIAASNVWTRVDGLTEDFDVGDGTGGSSSGWFDPATGRFSPGRTGYLEMKASVRLESLGAGSRMEAQVRKNGADHIALSGPLHSGSNAGGLGEGSSVYLRADAATDYFEVFVRHSGAVTKDLLTGLANTWVAGRYVGPL